MQFNLRLVRREKIDRHISIALVIFSAWLLLVFVSPFLISPGQIDDLSGAVLVLDNQEILRDVNPIAWIVYTLGDINCHQVPERSLFLNENQMPFCARDIGIFIGLVAGIILALFFLVPFNLKRLAIGLVPVTIDGALQLLTTYESDNAIRILTGAAAGIAVALFISDLIAMPTEEKVNLSD